MEQQHRDLARWSRQRAHLNGLRARMRDQHPRDQDAADQQSGDSKQHRNSAAARPFFFSGV